MTLAASHLLPSLGAFGAWSFWILALVALLESLVLTGWLVPGAMIVIVAGMLTQIGVFDLVDLAWAVACGSWVGSTVSFQLGRLAAAGMPLRLAQAGVGQAGQALRRVGPAALMAGRLRGPLPALTPYAAGLQGMRPLMFALWNAVGAVLSALVLLGTGAIAGRAAGILAAAAPRVVVIGVIGGAALAVVFWTWRRARRVWPALRGIAGNLRTAVIDAPAVRRMIDRHPRLTGFFAARFGTDQFLGLTATVLGALLVYLAVAYADSVYDFLGSGGTASSDTRVANLFYALRDDRLTAVLGWITEIGGRHGVLPLLAGATLTLLALRRLDLLAGLWIAAVGNQFTVTVLKSFFGRPRSALGYYVETSGSFPSGHAAGAVAVWAMLFYLGWRLRALRLDVAIVAAVVTAALIGISRIYLVEHYVSDVLNGYLVGGFWLTLGIAFCEWRRPDAPMALSRPRRRIATGCMVLAGIAAIGIASTTVSPVNPAVDRRLLVVADPGRLLSLTAQPAMTRTLWGAPRRPVDLIVTVPDMAALSSAVTAAGWLPAPRPRVAQLAHAAIAQWTGQALPQPLVIPTFWDDRPTTLAFAWPAGPESGPRLHLRLWDSLARTQGGQVIFVATLTQEDPLDWDADGALGADAPGPRARLSRDLTAAGLAVVQL